MPSHPKPGAVFFAKDISRVARFYQELLDMGVTHSDEGVIVLESSRQQLVIHGIPRQIAKSMDITAPPKRREEDGFRRVFMRKALQPEAGSTSAPAIALY